MRRLGGTPYFQSDAPSALWGKRRTWTETTCLGTLHPEEFRMARLTDWWIMFEASQWLIRPENDDSQMKRRKH